MCNIFLFCNYNNNSLNIVYFLTFGYSLKTWEQSSVLNREAKYFNFLSENFGYKFFLITYGDDEDLKYKYLFDNVEIIPIYKYIKKYRFKLVNFIFSFFYPLKLKNLIYEDISIIKQNQLLGTWVSYFFKKITKSKLFIRTGYDMYFFSIKDNKSIVKKMLYRELTRLSLRIADLYTVSSKSDYEFLKIKFLKGQNQDVSILPNWVDIAESEIITHREDKIISVGRLEYQKNYPFLIKELSEVSQKIIIYGQGSEKLNLISIAEKLKLNLEIFENIDNESLIKNLSKAKYFVLASHFEGNPKALLEAMGAGCIVLTSKIPNHEEIIINNENGFLFEIKNNSLRDLFEKISSNQEANLEKLQTVSSNAINTVSSNFSISKIAEQENRLMRNL